MTAVGAFSAAAWPYAAKLAWAPVVDCVSARDAAPRWLLSLCPSLATLGPRKSWIVPVQLASSVLMLAHGPAAAAAVAAGAARGAAAFFLPLVALAATQDVAVDGWALVLLSRSRVGYASTCQTFGTNAGFFLSCAALLALGDPSFCASWSGSPPGVAVWTLAGYLRFWGWAYACVTAAVAVGTTEARAPPGEPLPPRDARRALTRVAAAYADLAAVARLPAVRRLGVLLLTCRLAVLPAEAVAPLALASKGVSTQAVAGLVLLQLPAELVAALLAGRAAAAGSASRAWVGGYWLRLAAAAATTLVVVTMPDGGAAPSSGCMGALAGLGLATAATSALQFTLLGALYARVGDPAMGGAYLTLLNTVANVGLTLPKAVAFWAADAVGLGPASAAALLGGLALGAWYAVAMPALERAPLKAWRA